MAKNLFVKSPKQAYVVRCKECKSEFWSKKKSDLMLSFYPKNTCPSCKTKSSLFVPDNVPTIKRERMYRFFEDEDKARSVDLMHYELMEEWVDEMDYQGHWGDTNPGFVFEISEKLQEELK